MTLPVSRYKGALDISNMRPTSSLRANGPRECAPDGKLSEAIHSTGTQEWIASLRSQ
jgi:hypothetical protein